MGVCRHLARAVILTYLLGLAAGGWLSYRTWQFLSVMSPEYARPTTWAMCAGTLFWPLLPAAAAICMLLGLAVACCRKTPK